MKRTLMILCTLLAAGMAAAPFARAASAAPDYTPLIDKYRRIFQEEMAQNKAAGLSVALVDGERIVWSEGFGYYNAEYKSRVTGKTPFLIGSIAKTFTGLAVMKLREQRRVDLDKPLRAYVPRFGMKTRFGSLDAVTVRTLMTHHGGVPDFIRDKFMASQPPFSKVLDYVNDDYATFPPNTVFSYSNAGVSLLGMVVETVAGKNYYNYVREHILEPIGMREAGFFSGYNAPESVWLGYDGEGNERRELPILDAPAGCMYASAEDMAKYIQTLLGGGTRNGIRVFEPATLAEIMKVQNQDVFLDFGQPTGLIWSIFWNDAGRSIQHDGGTMYHRAEVSISPDAGLGIVMLTNSVGGAKSLLHADYEILAEAVRIKGLRPHPAELRARNLRHPGHDFVYREGVTPVEATVPRQELERRTGRYGTFGMILSLSLPHESLKADIQGRTVYLLPVAGGQFVPAPENLFESADPKKRFYFEEVNGGTLLVQVDEWGNHSVLAERLEVRPVPEAWLRRAGTYNHDGENRDYQLLSDFRLEHQDGVMVLRASLNIEGLGPPEIVAPLRLVGDDLAVIAGYGRFSGQAVQFAKDPAGGEVMKVFGFRCTKR